MTTTGQPRPFEVVPIEEEMKRSYLDYAMSVIVARALPDVRDGLKPVQRRILYAMAEAGYEASKPHRKSARIVGDAITRNPDNDFATVAAFIQGPELQVAPFKGIKQNFRSWDGQFRQPIIIATDKVPVSVSPQRGFPHASHPEIEVDTLGIDEPESKCQM